MEIVDKFYCPMYANQGQEIPLYIIWNKEKQITVKILLPEGITVKNIFNVEENELKITNDSFLIEKFEINGYLGLTLLSKIYADASVQKTIFITIIFNENEYLIEKNIELFRPNIQFKKPNQEIEPQEIEPQEIDITVDENNKIIIKKKVLITNDGTGTGIVILSEDDDSELKQNTPSGIKEFSENFTNDFVNGLNKLKKKYPQYSEILDDLIQTTNKDFYLGDDSINQLKSIYNRLFNIIESDYSFYENYIGNILSAYMKNISIITEIESFVIFLRSVYLKKIIFPNSLNTFKISTDYKILKAHFNVTDLVYNKYDSLKLPLLKIKSNKECEIPLHLLFKFG